MAICAYEGCNRKAVTGGLCPFHANPDEMIAMWEGATVLFDHTEDEHTSQIAAYTIKSRVCGYDNCSLLATHGQYCEYHSKEAACLTCAASTQKPPPARATARHTRTERAGRGKPPRLV